MVVMYLEIFYLVTVIWNMYYMYTVFWGRGRQFMSWLLNCGDSFYFIWLQIMKYLLVPMYILIFHRINYSFIAIFFSKLKHFVFILIMKNEAIVNC